MYLGCSGGRSPLAEQPPSSFQFQPIHRDLVEDRSPCGLRQRDTDGIEGLPATESGDTLVSQDFLTGQGQIVELNICMRICSCGAPHPKTRNRKARQHSCCRGSSVDLTKTTEGEKYLVASKFPGVYFEVTLENNIFILKMRK